MGEYGINSGERLQDMKFSIDFFKKREQELDSIISELNSKCNKYSIFRLVTFLVCVALIIAGAATSLKTVFFILAAAVFIGFITLCVFHTKCMKELKYKSTLRDINSEYIARIESDFDKLKDHGDEFAVKEHDYSIDLDLFGESSLFSLYNISDSAFGRYGFAQELLKASTYDRSIDQLKTLQNTVSALGKDVIFLQEYQAIERLAKMTKMPDDLLTFSSKDIKPFPKGLRIIYKVDPFLWLIPAVLYFLGIKLYIVAALVLVLFNLILSFALRNKYAEYFKPLDSITKETKSIRDLFIKLQSSGIEDENFKKHLTDEDGTLISDKLEGLSEVCKKCQLRSQPLYAFVLNLVGLYDLSCADKLISWGVNNKTVLPVSVAMLTKIESMMSASVVEIISDESTRPVFVECDSASADNAFFDGENIRHPLINQKKVVSNSIKLDRKIALITGSNMSGKTTLIRTVGTLSLLAYMGANVPATSLKLGRMRIVSSMRIVDDIKEEMSTFKAELVRISRIVSASKENKPMMFLIDEIFRGTNSADRTEGAMTVLNILSKDNTIGMMTTHDYALCDECQKSKDNISYYYFTETYDDKGIKFDYKLGYGVSHTSNAKYLMKLVGIE